MPLIVLYSPGKIREGNLTGTEIPVKNFSKIWLYLTKLSSFTEIPENTRHWKF